jgi:hypothetical protein
MFDEKRYAREFELYRMKNVRIPDPQIPRP